MQRAQRRAVTSTDWLTSRHSFSFGPHYDPANVAFGPLIAVNSDEVRPGPGYVSHSHACVEILTFVLEGVLEHELAGLRTLVAAGQLQHLSVGRVVQHAERSGSEQPVRVLQMWLAGRASGDPSYAVAQLPAGRWVLAASSERPAPVRLCSEPAQLWRAVLQPGDELDLPSRSLFVVVVRGEVDIDGVRLGAEDTGRGSARKLSAGTAAELFVWEFARA